MTRTLVLNNESRLRTAFGFAKRAERPSLRLSDCEVNVVPLMNKDSLEMTDADRVLILGMVRPY